jgi:hypothetical protein
MTTALPSLANLKPNPAVAVGQMADLIAWLKQP